MKRLALFLAYLTFATPVAAHPYTFVDTGIDAIFDASGQLSAVRVTWQYDDEYSMLITEDMGLDSDHDGLLNPDEMATLAGFDMQWIDGFNGDLEIRQEGRLLALSGPLEPTALFDGGRITTTHLRRVTDAAPGGMIVIKPYDPTYYTAYDVTLPTRIEGADACHARVQMPDISDALKDLQERLSTLDPNAEPQDVGLPNIGAQLAQDIIITCGG